MFEQAMDCRAMRAVCRRLLMMGCTNAELWNNLGLCCFYASQYDMTVRCFENALTVADDLAQADVWYVDWILKRCKSRTIDKQKQPMK